jgi:undecaprenyl-diphosphatase
MYLGVHTPADVGVSVAVALVLIFGLYPCVEWALEKRCRMRGLLAVMVLVAAAFLVFVNVYPFPADVDAHNLESGMKNAWTMVGCMTGVGFVYNVERKYVNFTTLAVWWAQILKIGFGFLAVLAIKSGLKEPLDALCHGHMFGRALRYFLIVIMAGVIWPLTFKWFSKLGRKN